MTSSLSTETGTRPSRSARRPPVPCVGMQLLVASLCGLASCSGAASGPSVRPSTAGAVEAYHARDAVRVERETRDAQDPTALALRAWALATVGRGPEAREAEDAALADPALADSLAAGLLADRVDRLARDGAYADAARAARSALADPRVRADSARRVSVENDGRLWAALDRVPPTTAQGAGESPVHLDAVGLRRTAVRVGPAPPGDYVLDTGANLSTLAASEAARLGLVVRAVGVNVGGVTGARVPAGLAVADAVVIAGVRVGPVPFLVFPDSALAFPQIGYAIEGVIGLPVLEALAPLELPLADGPLRVGVPPRRGVALVFDGLAPVIRVPVRLADGTRDTVACYLDTGASDTVFHAPFYARHRFALNALGHPADIGLGGAGGARTISAIEVDSLQVEWPDRPVSLRAVSVYTDLGDGAADCRLGLDAFAGARALFLDPARRALTPVW